VTDETRFEAAWESRWAVGWCCSYCSAPLRTRGHGLYCAEEGRWFATLDGVHRLLTEERRRELLPLVELEQRMRRDEGWRTDPGLPETAPDHPQAELWKARAQRFRSSLEQVAPYLPTPPWRILDVGAGCCWASARLVEHGHEVVAVDVDLDPETGLPAAGHLLVDPSRLPRAEAEMEALPLEAGAFDLVLAVGALHTAPRLTRALVELRRVLRRNGILLALESPVYRRRHDGEAAVERAMKACQRRYGLTPPRESHAGYLILDEMSELFRSCGFKLDVRGWPGPLRERVDDLLTLARGRRPAPRFPILIARRDG
jgi:SAM-dependent methyltransferase